MDPGARCRSDCPCVFGPPLKPCRFTVPANPRPLRNARDVYRLALGEQPCIELLSDLHAGKVGCTDLTQVAEELAAGLVEVPPLRLVPTLDLLEADLDGLVTVRIGRLDLRHRARARLDGRHANGLAGVLAEHLRRPDLLSQQRLNAHDFRRPSRRDISCGPPRLFSTP